MMNFSKKTHFFFVVYKVPPFICVCKRFLRFKKSNFYFVFRLLWSFSSSSCYQQHSSSTRIFFIRIRSPRRLFIYFLRKKLYIKCFLLSNRWTISSHFGENFLYIFLALKIDWLLDYTMSNLHPPTFQALSILSLNFHWIHVSISHL